MFKIDLQSAQSNNTKETNVTSDDFKKHLQKINSVTSFSNFNFANKVSAPEISSGQKSSYEKINYVSQQL